MRGIKGAGWFRVVGVDISQSRVARAQQKYPNLRFYDRPLAATDIERDSFDLAIMDNVIEHLTSPKPVLAELQTYLRAGGRIVVITPNLESGEFRLLGCRWTPELAPHAHIFLFTEASLTALLNDVGFIVEYSGTFHTPIDILHPWRDLLKTGRVKHIVWRLMQQAGGAYARIVKSGAMTFVVARSVSSTEDCLR